MVIASMNLDLNQFANYARLMRLDKPIGILLLLWPTLWALWLASDGHPDIKITAIFVVSVILMRSAGCIVNDFFDRHVDGKVDRTRDRPLASGKVSVKEALTLATLLSACAFGLVLCCNFLTIILALCAGLFIVIYPLLKRITHLPQLGLGIAFSWGIPMAFAAICGKVELRAWILFAASVWWPMIYDTFYAMVDRACDMRVGIKSTAILFAQYDRYLTGAMQIIFISMMFVVGKLFHLQISYDISLIFVTILFVYQQWLIRNRDEKACFRAFLNNNYVGFVIFIGITLT